MANDTGPTSFVYNEMYDIQYLIEHGRRKWKRRICFDVTGGYLSEDETDELLRSIMEFKWLESEKAGRDLYGHGRDGLVKAGKDLVRRSAEVADKMLNPEQSTLEKG